MRIKILNKEFEIKAKNLGEDKPFWDNSYLHYKFRITVKNLENNKKISFLFWDSTNNYLEGKKELEEEDLILCFKCLLEDAISFLDNPNIDEFSKEFGFEKVSEALRAFKGCKKQFEKCLKLGLTENEVYDLINEIIQKENENNLLSLKL
jgi:hypothetical protein